MSTPSTVVDESPRLEKGSSVRDMILFLVSFGNKKVVTYALNRESAKRNAHTWIGGNADLYTITPLTSPGDVIHLSVSLYV